MGIKIQKLRDSAKDQSCICCGAKDGTVVGAHYQGYRSNLLGGGKGVKVHDLFTAHLCARCHAKMDQYQADIRSLDDLYTRKIDHSEQFMFHILMTWLRLYQQGRIEFK